VPASPPASPTPELPVDPEPLPDPELPLDPEDPEPPLDPELSLVASLEPELPADPDPPLDPESAPLLEPELPSEPLLLNELPELLPDPLPEPEPLPLDDDVMSFTPASPFPLFEPELPQPADRPTKATSVVSVANLAPSQSFITSS
jgi:hypothetical protein